MSRRAAVVAAAVVVLVVAGLTAWRWWPTGSAFEDAVATGIRRAHKTIKNIRGAWIAQQKVKVEKGKVTEYRVTMRVTFVLTD